MHLMTVQTGAFTRVLVSLKHDLGSSSVRIPELHASVFGSTENPLAVWCKSDTENKVLITMLAQ